MRVIGRPFVKGISGNPGGRPKGRSKVVELAVKLSPGALKTLAAIMNDPDAERSDRIRAAEAILNRGLGKVSELPDEKPQTFAFFEPVSEEQVALAERMVRALPENAVEQKDAFPYTVAPKGKRAAALG